MESEDELSHSKRHDADSGRHRFLWRHGWKFLRARLSKRPQVVGAKSRRRDWRRRHYLFGQWDAKGRRCKRSHRNSVANRNHNRQDINTWIGVSRSSEEAAPCASPATRSTLRSSTPLPCASETRWSWLHGLPMFSRSSKTANPGPDGFT